MGVSLAFGDFVTGDLLELFVARLEDHELRARSQREQDRAGVNDRTETGTAHAPAHPAAAPARAARPTWAARRTTWFRLIARRGLAKKRLRRDGAIERSARRARAATRKRSAPGQRAVLGVEAEQLVVRCESVEHS